MVDRDLDRAYKTCPCRSQKLSGSGIARIRSIPEIRGGGRFFRSRFNRWYRVCGGGGPASLSLSLDRLSRWLTRETTLESSPPRARGLRSNDCFSVPATASPVFLPEVHGVLTWSDFFPESVATGCDRSEWTEMMRLKIYTYSKRYGKGQPRERTGIMERFIDRELSNFTSDRSRCLDVAE